MSNLPVKKQGQALRKPRQARPARREYQEPQQEQIQHEPQQVPQNQGGTGNATQTNVYVQVPPQQQYAQAPFQQQAVTTKSKFVALMLALLLG